MGSVMKQFLEAQDRIDFERRRLPLRLLLLITPLFLFLDLGPSAAPAALIITASVLGSFSVIRFLLDHQPKILLRVQLGLRILDVGLFFLCIYSIRYFFGSPYSSLDAFYVLTVVAATGTHRMTGAAVISAAAIVAIVVSRLQLASAGVTPFGMDQVVVTLFFLLLFLLTGSMVAIFMETAAKVMERREEGWRMELAEQNSALQALTAQLQDLVRQDPLTELPNRRRFYEELERHLTLAERYGTNGTLLLIDLDFFKDVNDKFGHASGDEVLIQLAALLQKQLRKTDLCARIGGDEFCILMPYTDVIQAQRVAERLLKLLNDQPLTIGQHNIAITLSIGIAAFPEHALTTSELLSHADSALYQAKAQGRNGVYLYGS